MLNIKTLDVYTVKLTPREEICFRSLNSPAGHATNTCKLLYLDTMGSNEFQRINTVKF